MDVNLRGGIDGEAFMAQLETELEEEIRYS
jgi:hypothetical protein